MYTISHWQQIIRVHTSWLNTMRKFITYLIVWVASNLSIPFWVVGHVHLTMNVYEDIYEIVMSLGMNLIVATGFWIEWKRYKKENPH
jgi:hypothetical protein